jgi:hypothetical protein
MNSEEARAITARAMVQAVDESKIIPTILISIYNGVIEDVSADRPCRVIILENDKYIDPRDYDGDAFVLWGETPTLLREWEVFLEDVSPDLFAEIQAARDCPRCENCGFPVPGGEFFAKENSCAKLCQECAHDDTVLVNDEKEEATQ